MPNSIETETPPGGKEPHRLLFLDDEAGILNALRRLFRLDPYSIQITTKPAEALAFVEANPVALVISDHRMPEMEGTKFLARVKEIRPDAVRIMLTGYADLGAAMEAINQSDVYRFISKPWNDDDLRLTVREALRQYDLVHLNRELSDLVKQQNQELFDINRGLEIRVRQRTAELEEKNRQLSELYQTLDDNFIDTVHAFMDLMELKNPALVGHCRRASDLARRTAAGLGLSGEAQTVCELATLLMDIGTIGYPEALLVKPEHEMKTGDAALYRKHPVVGETILRTIGRLLPVSAVIRSHHERFDGKGYPDGLRGEAIPLPARIAAAADCFDHLVNGETFDDRIPFPLAKQRLERERGGCFDPAVIRVLLEVAETSETAQHVDEAEIAVVELREGMTITRDIRTSGGMLLLVAGSTIQPRHLKRILAFHHVDPIVDRVRIRRSAS